MRATASAIFRISLLCWRKKINSILGSQLRIRRGINTLILNFVFLLSRIQDCWTGSIKSSLNKRKSTKCYMYARVLYKPLLTGCLQQGNIYILCYILKLFPVATQSLKRKFSDSSVLIRFIQLCFLCISSPSITLQICKKVVVYWDFVMQSATTSNNWFWHTEKR